MISIFILFASLPCKFDIGVTTAELRQLDYNIPP